MPTFNFARASVVVRLDLCTPTIQLRLHFNRSNFFYDGAIDQQNSLT